MYMSMYLCRDAKVPKKSGYSDFLSQLKIFPDFIFMTVMV